ncbi:MAG: hypothetical protein WCQ96_00295 [Patescibacteria group bacterium]
MKIKNVQLREEGQFVSLTADCKIRHIGTDRIYFKFEKKYRNFIATDASPFAAALFIPSMKMGQDLIIEGSISQKLQDGMQEIMKKMISWNLGLKPISIVASEVKPDETTTGDDASFFSGGVDSFYTYLKRKDQTEKIDYLILANGFDISLNNPDLWRQTCKTVDEIVRNEDVEVIKVESNIRELIEPVMVWEYTHGGCLAALGLALRNNLKNVYIPSSLAIGQLMPYGSHPDLDPLWSTEGLSFIHDDAEVKRIDKVKYIAQIPLALKHLRVCYINAQGKFNCGVCDKCLRTMMSLRIAGKLEEAETFPHSIDLELIKKITVSEKQNAVMHEENLEELERLGIDPELQKAIRNVLKDFYFPRFSLKKAAKKMRHFIIEALNQIMLIDFFYNQSRLHKKKVRWQKKSQKTIQNISRYLKAERNKGNIFLKRML